MRELLPLMRFFRRYKPLQIKFFCFLLCYYLFPPSKIYLDFVFLSNFKILNKQFLYFRLEFLSDKLQNGLQKLSGGAE